MLFSNFAVVSSGCCYCFPWKQLLFSPDVVTCFPDIAVVFSGSCRFCFMFLYKTFRNLYKTQYFLYKNRRKFQHVFSVFSGYILSGPRTFLLFSLTIANRKSCFWRSDRPQMAGFILVSRMFFMPFGDRLDRFFGFFLLLFLHFCCLPAKKALLFFHPDHPFSRFFRFIGIFFCPVLRNFFIPFPFFQYFS